jgi:hypothetical protein
VYDVLKVNKSRKISLEIFPAVPETLEHHPVLANYRQNLRPPKEGLSAGIWRMPFPSPRLAMRVAQGPQKYAPQIYLGWYRRPWSGSILGHAVLAGGDQDVCCSDTGVSCHKRLDRGEWVGPGVGGPRGGCAVEVDK